MTIVVIFYGQILVNNKNLNTGGGKDHIKQIREGIGMLLNKNNVLDKGFVAPLCFNGGGRLLQDLQDHYFKANVNMKLLSISTATLVIKCPLFVQLNLSQYGFDIISTPSDGVEAYTPDLSMINGETIEDKQRVVDYISKTTEALMLNEKGMTMDGVDPFTSQLLMPITVYNELIVHGSLGDWLIYLKQSRLPKELEAYRCQVKEVLETEWKNVDSLLKLTP